jgi:hypothetical protein
MWNRRGFFGMLLAALGGQRVFSTVVNGGKIENYSSHDAVGLPFSVNEIRKLLEDERYSIVTTTQDGITTLDYLNVTVD